ncbi:hypothetical protein C0995_013974 [Termitomyces sp. Mi166|nr:hypothetical protein C0995_013974 [Termitomyces sp. Mi166\
METEVECFKNNIPSSLKNRDVPKVIGPAPKRMGGILSERPRHQEGDIDEREYRLWQPDQIAPPRDRRPTSPPRSAPAAGSPELSLVKVNPHQHPQLLPRPPASASAPPAPQVGAVSLDLQPAPPTSNSHIHSSVLQNSSRALAPIRVLYEQAWYQTVSNVQNEMSRMHRELVDALERERTARSRLAEENKVLQLDLERTRADLRNVRRDSEKFKGQCDRLIAENESLRQVAKDQVAQRSDRDDQVREAARLYIDEQLDQLKTQYGEQMEKNRVEAERTLEKQKAMFEKERRELHKIAVAHERSVQRSGSESASTLVASDTEKVLSPFYDQGPHKDSAQQESIHYDRPRGHRMSVSSGTRSPTSASPQLFSGSLSRHQTVSYRPLSPLTPSTPPKEVFPTITLEDPHANNHRHPDETDNAMDVDMDMDVEMQRDVVDLSSPTTSQIPHAPTHHRSILPKSLAHHERHMSSSRSPSIPLASILPKPLSSSPLPIDDRPTKRDQPAQSARPTSLPVTMPKARSRQPSSSSQTAPRATPPMGSLGMRPYSQPASRCASRAVSPKPHSQPASRPSRPNSAARPVLKVDISPVIPPIAVLEESSRQQQELSSSPELLKTEPQLSSLMPPGQVQPQSVPQRAQRQSSKPATPQPQQQQQQQQPQHAPFPAPPQQFPFKPQLPQPAQPSKQPMAQSSPPSHPSPPQPQLRQNRHHPKPPQPPQQNYTYQSHFPLHQPGSRAWISYPYSQYQQYQHPPPPQPPLPVPPPVPAAPHVSASAASSSSFSSTQTQRKRDRVEYEQDSGAGERARAKVKLEDGSPVTVAAAAAIVEVKEVKKTNKIGITHMDLLYETRGTKLICRMCRLPSKDEQKTPTVTFPVDAKWVELIGHCQNAHPKLCADLEKLSPSQVQELRQRMQSGKLTGYTLRS